jgi:hypothetical protein
MSKRRNDNKLNAFETDTSAEEVADEIYGKATELDTGRLVANPKPILDIWPDLRQPRRAVPTSVRGNWNGDPDELSGVLDHWRLMAEKESGKKIDVLKALNGFGALEVEDSNWAIYASYAKLVGLAFAIKHEGLTNPITIIRNGSMWQIETGERRWLAHHLLAQHIDEKRYGKIAAREVAYDPFRQASENNARDGYNAIEMARQIALLIMESRKDLEGMKYDKFEDMVYAGECDRKFYAQVANGYIHKIPDGRGDKICNATGLSFHRISQYRRLLAPTEDDAINDQIWVDADANGWTENYIRETVLPSLKPKEEPKEGSLTAVKHHPENEGGITPDKTQSGTQTLPTRFSQWTDKDAFGRVVEPPKPSPFGQTQTPHVVGNGGQIGASAARPLSKAEEFAQMNLTGKKVRLADYRVGFIEEDRGQKLYFRKEGASPQSFPQEIYRTAIMSIITDGDTPPASPKPSLKEGDRVVVNNHGIIRHGVIRKVKDDGYNVYLDASQTTHWYESAIVSPEPASDNTSSAKQETALPAKAHNPNEKLITDSKMHVMVSQLAVLAKMLELSDAEITLLKLRDMSYADIDNLRQGLSADGLHAVLQQDYDNVATLTNRLLAVVTQVIEDIADIDAAERQGE